MPSFSSGDGDGSVGAPARSTAAAKTAAFRLVNAGLGLGASVAISRALQPQGRGVYAIAATLAALAAVVGGAALPRALQFAWGRREQPSDLAGAAVAAGLGGGALAAVVFGAIAMWYPPLTPQGATIVWVAVAGVPTWVAASHLTVLLSLRGRPDAAAAATLAAGALQSVLLIGGALAGLLTPTRVIAITTLSLVVLLPAHLRALGHEARVDAARRRLAAGLARQAVRYHPATLAAHLLLRADVLMLAALSDTAQVGQYSLALALAEAILLVTGSVAQAGSGAQATGTADDDPYTARLARTTLALALLLAAGVAATARVVVPALFGAAFAPAVTPLLLLLPGACALAATPPLELAVSRRDRPGVASAASAGALALVLALDVALIPRWGPAGAAAASSVAYSLQFAVLAAWFLRTSGLRAGELLRPRAADLLHPLRTVLRLSAKAA